VFTAVAIDLVVKKEVGCQATCLGGINSTFGVAENELACGRFTIDVLDVEFHLDGGLAAEKDCHFVAESQVLRSLANVEIQACFAFPRVAAEDLGDAIFQCQA
jgi:hypothetical protein